MLVSVDHEVNTDATDNPSVLLLLGNIIVNDVYHLENAFYELKILIEKDKGRVTFDLLQDKTKIIAEKYSSFLNCLNFSYGNSMKNDLQVRLADTKQTFERVKFSLTRFLYTPLAPNPIEDCFNSLELQFLTTKMAIEKYIGRALGTIHGAKIWKKTPLSWTSSLSPNVLL